jgi:hypothetical protein
MTEEQDQDKVVPIADQTTQGDMLPFRVELWRDGAGDAVERLLALAISASLGRAIFKAALTEHPNRRITLRRGTRVIADSDKE